MKKNILKKIAVIFLLCSVVVLNCFGQETINRSYSKAAIIEGALQQLANEGVPGAAIAVYSREGWWTTSAGLSRIEDKTPMQMNHLQYLQSASKTFMAVGILKLYEQGKIDLEAPMTKYLPEKLSQYIPGAEKITVHMLMNHTSGIREYNSEPAYVTQLLQHPDYPFTPEEYLKYIGGKPMNFAPGSKYSYRNTNYLILALMADAITGDHRKFLSETIMKPLGLTDTYYQGDPGYLNYPNLVNSYWDRHSDGVLENATVLQRNNVAALIGDDGVVATPVDAVKFLRGLLEGKLLKPATMELMKTWAMDSKGNPTYGLGLDYTKFGEHVAYGHSGGGLGAGCQLYYIVDAEVYFFVGINLGTVTDSPLHEGVSKTLDEIHKALSDGVTKQ